MEQTNKKMCRFNRFSYISFSIFLLILIFPMVTYATNGYLLHGYGKNKGLGGAGSANPQDALAAGHNPAGSAFVGERFDMTGELFSPSRGYDIYAPDKPCAFTFRGPTEDCTAGHAFVFAGGEEYEITSEKEIFMIPAMGIVKQMDEKNFIGFAMYGAGLGTEYSRDDTPGANGTFFSGSTGVDLLLIMGNFHAAHKVNEDLAIGAGIVVAAQSFKAKGLQPFNLGTLPGTSIAEKERDWAFGAGWNIGVQYNFNEKISMAASYYSKIGLNHDAYTGLFAGKGDFTLAPQVILGLTYKPTKKSAISFDIQHIMWTEVASTSNPLLNLFNPDFNPDLDPSFSNFPINLLGDDNSAGFGFGDSTVYKIGYQFELGFLPRYTWRVGYSWQEQIIPAKNGTLFTTLAPATITEHYTFGFTRDINDAFEFNFNFLLAPKEYVKGEALTEGVDIWLVEYGFEFGLGYKF